MKIAVKKSSTQNAILISERNPLLSLYPHSWRFLPPTSLETSLRDRPYFSSLSSTKMTTGPSSKSRATQERCSRDPRQVGDFVIPKGPGEKWAFIWFSWAAMSHTLWLWDLRCLWSEATRSYIDDVTPLCVGGLCALLWSQMHKNPTNTPNQFAWCQLFSFCAWCSHSQVELCCFITLLYLYVDVSPCLLVSFMMFWIGQVIRRRHRKSKTGWSSPLSESDTFP